MQDYLIFTVIFLVMAIVIVGTIEIAMNFIGWAF